MIEIREKWLGERLGVAGYGRGDRKVVTSPGRAVRIRDVAFCTTADPGDHMIS